MLKKLLLRQQHRLKSAKSNYLGNVHQTAQHQLFYKNNFLASQHARKHSNSSFSAANNVKPYKINNNTRRYYVTSRDRELDEWIVDSYYNIKTQHLQAAIKSCNMALRIDPSNTTALYNKGIAYQKEEKLSLAAEMFQYAIKIDHNCKHAHTALAAIYHAESLYEAAEKHYTRALLAAPKYKRAHFGLAVLLNQIGKLTRSELHYKQGTVIDYKEHYDDRFPTYLIQSRYFSHLHEELRTFFESAVADPYVLLEALIDEYAMHNTPVETENYAAFQLAKSKSNPDEDLQQLSPYRINSGLVEILPNSNMRDSGSARIVNENNNQSGDICLKGGIIASLMYHRYGKVDLIAPF